VKRVDLELCIAALQRLAEKPCRYEELRKCLAQESKSPGRVSRAIRVLVENGWIVKEGPLRSRAPYRITEKGRLFLRSMVNSVHSKLKGGE